MKYYIHDKYNDRKTEYEDWWELVGHYYEAPDNCYWGTRTRKVDGIAHNDNDIYSYWDYKFNRRPDENVDYEAIVVEQALSYLCDTGANTYCKNERHIYGRYDFIYDEDGVAVNKREIEDAFKDYDPEKAKARRYYNYYANRRRWNSKRRHWNGWRNNIRRNKTYAAKLMEYYDLFPNDGKMRQYAWFVKTWNDDIPDRSTGRGWKDQSKKRKQWM